jgi:hypothetical protein
LPAGKRRCFGDSFVKDLGDRPDDSLDVSVDLLAELSVKFVEITKGFLEANDIGFHGAPF